MAEVVEHFGAIDVVVVRERRRLGPRHRHQPQGAWRTLKAAAPNIAASQGHMVAVSSLIAYVHPPLLASYAPERDPHGRACGASASSPWA